MKKKILQHIAVEQFYEDSDGYWVILKNGYEWYGVTCIHEDTLHRVWEMLKSITKVN